MKAIVDQDKCIGCTLCTQVCPEVFRMEGDKSIAYTNPIPDGLVDACKDAASQCPVEAITVA